MRRSSATRARTPSGTSPAPSAGSTCRRSRRSASATSSRSKAARRSRVRRRSPGRLVERSKGKDTTTGHWELMGVVTPQAMPTYPLGFPDEVIDPFMNRTGRGVLGNKPASGTEIIQELGEEHQRTGKWIVYTSADSVFQIAAHEETIPLEELYDACRTAREILTGQARRRPRDRAAVRRRARLVRAHAEPARLLARAEAAELPDRSSATPATRCTASGRSPTSSRISDIDEEFPTKSNVEGIQTTEELLRTIDDGLVFTNLVETDIALGAPQRPGQLPPLPAGLRPPAARPARRAAAERPADPHLRPRLRPDDAVDRPLARARAAARVRRGPQRGGPDPRGWRVRRRRRDRQRVARRQGVAAWRARNAVRRAVSRLDDPALVASEYADERASAAVPPAMRGPVRARTHASHWSTRSSRLRPGASSRSGAAGVSSPSGLRERPGPRWSRSTSPRAWSSLRRNAGSTRASPTCRRCRSRMRPSTSPWRRGCSTTYRISGVAWRRSRASCVRAGRLSRRPIRASTSRSCATSSAAGRRP